MKRTGAFTGPGAAVALTTTATLIGRLISNVPRAAPKSKRHNDGGPANWEQYFASKSDNTCQRLLRSVRDGPHRFQPPCAAGTENSMARRVRDAKAAGDGRDHAVDFCYEIPPRCATASQAQKRCLHRCRQVMSAITILPTWCTCFGVIAMLRNCM